MPHPSSLIPKNPYYLDGDVTATLSSGYFFAVSVLADSVIAIKGGGIFEYVAADSGTTTHLGSDGEALGASHPAGFYEAASSQAVTFTVPAGVTIYGRFTELDQAASNKTVAYK